VTVAFQYAQLVFAAIGAVFGIISGVCWVRAARVEIPIIYDTRGMTFFGGTHDHTEPQRLDPVVEKLREQAGWNSWAANSAAVAAFAATAAFLCQVFPTLSAWLVVLGLTIKQPAPPG
jgi:hypothetical protein